MSGAQQQGMGQPVGVSPFPNKTGMTKEGVSEGSTPGYTLPPPDQGGGQAATPNQQQPNGLGIWQDFSFYGRPIQQTYGGQPSPYANVHDYIRDTWNMTGNGAGRFGSNNVSRYGFAGGGQWRPDTIWDISKTTHGPYAPNMYGPQGMQPPQFGVPPWAQYGQQPGGGISPPPGGNAPPGGPMPKPPPKTVGSQDWAGFMRSNPAAARRAMTMDVGGYMKAKPDLIKAFGGDQGFNSWLNSNDPMASNTSLDDPATILAAQQFLGRR